MKLIQISDIHGETKFIKPAGEIIHSADLVLITGDISKSGSVSSADNVLKSIEEFNSNILGVHGNWDGADILRLLEERGYSVHADGREFDGMGFFGVGGSSPTPMKSPSEYSKDQITGFLNSGYSKLSGSCSKILLSHPPPRNTRDKTFFGLRGGSAGVREFIESNSILLCLSGHIHEASGIEKLNNCLVANPGPFKKGMYLMINMDNYEKIDAGNLKLSKIDL